VINGLWLEDDGLAKDAAFAEAMARGMSRFARFLDAARVNSRAVVQPRLRKALTSRS
jgi:hypothetical protein